MLPSAAADLAGGAWRSQAGVVAEDDQWMLRGRFHRIRFLKQRQQCRFLAGQPCLRAEQRESVRLFAQRDALDKAFGKLVGTHLCLNGDEVVDGPDQMH